MNYRLAAQDEWPAIAPLWEECFPGTSMPNPDHVAIAIAEEGGQIVGFLTAQTIMNIDQLGVATSHRGGKVSFGKLLEPLESLALELDAPGYVTFATQPRDRRMSELGYITPPWLVYRRMF